MTKKFRSNSVIAINGVLENGENVHVSFSAVTGDGSVFYTDDEELQKGLRNHHGFGGLFYEEDVLEVEQQEPELTDEKPNKELPVIHVDSLEEAAEYLCEHFSFSRTRLKNKKSILKAAMTSGISFEGI